jgi:hypothetical protein
MLFDLRNFITGCLTQFFTLDKDRSDFGKQIVRVRQPFGILRQFIRNKAIGVMSDGKDNSWLWDLALIGIFFASLWYCVKWSWQVLQMPCGCDAKNESLVSLQPWVLGQV